VTGGDFEGSLTIDHRLFSESGRNDILKQLNYSKNLVITPFTAASGAYSSAEDNKKVWTFHFFLSLILTKANVFCYKSF
jgi:hypothetical protein